MTKTAILLLHSGIRSTNSLHDLDDSRLNEHGLGDRDIRRIVLLFELDLYKNRVVRE
jgi:hypothetical protein